MRERMKSFSALLIFLVMCFWLLCKYSIQGQSIATGDDQRDGHLKSAEFFEVDKFPTLSFVSSSFREVDNGEYKLKGILEIKGVKKEVTLDVEFGGISKDPWGSAAMGLGLATAKELASQGVNLTLVDFNQKSLDAAVKDLKKEFPSVKIVSVVGDASKEQDVQKYVDEAVKAFGRIDGLYNNFN